MVSAQKKSSKHSALSPVRLSHDRWRRTASYSSIHPSIYYHLIYRLWAERGDGWMDGRMDGFLVLSEKGSIPPPPCVSINFSLQGKRQTTLYSKHQLTEQSIKTRLKALGVVTPSLLFIPVSLAADSVDEFASDVHRFTKKAALLHPGSLIPTRSFSRQDHIPGLYIPNLLFKPVQHSNKTEILNTMYCSLKHNEIAQMLTFHKQSTSEMWSEVRLRSAYQVVSNIKF